MDLSIFDVAKLLKVSENTIYRWLGDGELPASKVNDVYRVNAVELLEWATVRRIELSPDFLRHFEPRQAPEISTALRAGGVHAGIPGADKQTVLEAAVARLPLPASADRATVMQLILARESAGTTAIGQGIAIPHVRMPIVVRTQQPVVATCYLERPVDFNAPDGRPVETLFIIFSTSVHTHLYLLSKLAFALHDPEVKSALAQRAPLDELVEAVSAAERLLRPRPVTTFLPQVRP